MPMELHHFNDEVPGSSPGGSNMRGHSSMVERAVSSKPCRRALRKIFADGNCHIVELFLRHYTRRFIFTLSRAERNPRANFCASSFAQES